VQGQCDCKENVIGKNCDMCKPLYHNLDRGCIRCNCFVQGTLDGVGECDTEVNFRTKIKFDKLFHEKMFVSLV